jgi:hypothetical protein
VKDESKDIPASTEPGLVPESDRRTYTKGWVRLMGTTRMALWAGAIGLLASAVLWTPVTSASPSEAAPHRFTAIKNMALPGLPPADWPTVAILSSPPGVSETANVSSNDFKYTVSFYDFRSRGAAKAFYDAPPGAMITFLPGALGYTSLGGPTGIPGRSRGLDLRSCVGEGAGVSLFPDGRCSTGAESFSIGVGTIARIGKVVMMVGYVRNNALTQAANPSELGHNARVAMSGLVLLRSIGINDR